MDKLTAVPVNASDLVAMTISRKNCETLSYRQTLYHRFVRNADGTALRCRINGAVKTWATRPNDFRIPVKSALRGYGYITQQNGDGWCLREPIYAGVQS